MSQRLATAQEWARAYQQAVKEIQLPPRGLRGCFNNRVRRELGPLVFLRARQILKAGQAKG